MNQSKIIKAILYIVTVLIFGVLTQRTIAHPGRTDSYGCHTCRTNCPSWGLDYGEYHCHNAKTLPQPEPPIKSTFSEGGTGFTEPAPQYKKPLQVLPMQEVATQTVNQSPIEVVNDVRTGHPKRGFWQWLFSLFR